MEVSRTGLLRDICQFILKKGKYREQTACEGFLLGAGLFDKIHVNLSQGADRYIPTLINALMDYEYPDPSDLQNALELYLLRMRDIAGHPDDSKIDGFINRWRVILQTKREPTTSSGANVSAGQPSAVSEKHQPPLQLHWVQIILGILASIVTIIVAILGFLAVGHVGPFATASFTPTATSPDATYTPLPATATPKATISTISWQTILSEPSPGCNDPSGTVWIKPFGDASTSITCNSNGTTLEETGRSYGEINLKSIRGNENYNQTDFQAQVTVILPTGDTSGTKAALLVQTPIGPSAGGYDLAIDAQNLWVLQMFVAGQEQPIAVTSGSVAQAGSMTLLVTVLNGHITLSINGVQVGSLADSFVSGVVALMVQNGGSGPVPATFSNFVFQTPAS